MRNGIHRRRPQETSKNDGKNTNVLPTPQVHSTIEVDVWFEPAVVVETIGAEITLSSIHTCAMDIIRKGSRLAICFPRFTGNYRLDKSAEDSTTVKEIIEMYQSQMKKLSG